MNRAIRDFCREHRIIYQSFWTLTANPHVLAHVTLQTLAAKYRRSAAQLFFRYLSQIGIIPLTGTTSESHMREDLAIFDFELTADECDAALMHSLSKAEKQHAGQIAVLVNSAYRGESSKQGWTTEADLLAGRRTDTEEILRLISRAVGCADARRRIIDTHHSSYSALSIS